MATGTATTKPATTDAEAERQLLLLGIARQREELQSRLNWLQQKENAVRAQGLTGTPRPKQATPAATGGSKKRTLSEAHKKKMSDAAKARWAERKNKAAAKPATEATAEVPPNPLETAATGA